MALEVWRKGMLLVLSGGTGNPLFSTDTAAVLRARELNAEVVLKGTKIRGVFTADPEMEQNAQFLERLSYQTALEKALKVMDAMAFTLCAEGKLPIVIFDLFQPGNLLKTVKGEKVGSMVC